MPRVIMFVFGGRRTNIQLALPYYKQILADNPDVDIHLWDLCRDPADSRYLRTITGTDRLTVRTEFYDGTGRATRGQNRVWNHYAGPEYRGTVFVKCDDDVVFYDTARFPQFVQSITDDVVTSALVINNGASSQHVPDLADVHHHLEIDLLDVHKSSAFAEHCHRWFFRNWTTITNQPGELVPTADWVSINCIGHTWKTGHDIAALIGVRTPREIAGRHFQPRGRVGDEGAVNMLPRRINTGFTVAHFGFGPQQFTPDTATELRTGYAELSQQHLAGQPATLP